MDRLLEGRRRTPDGHKDSISIALPPYKDFIKPSKVANVPSAPRQGQFWLHKIFDLRSLNDFAVS